MHCTTHIHLFSSLFLCFYFTSFKTINPLATLQQLMSNIEQPLATTNKSDIVFYRAFTELSHLSKFTLVVQLLKVGLLAALIGVDSIYLDVSYGSTIISIIINLVASCLGMLLYLLLVFSVFRNLETYSYIASVTKHTISNQPITDRSSLMGCVSETIFLAEGELKEVDISEQERSTHKKVTKNMISHSFKVKHGWVVFLENLYEVVSFASIIYTIVVLATTSMPLADTILLSIYVVVVGIFTTAHLIIACLIVVLAPVVCLGLCMICCCICCCCPGNSLNQKVIDVQQKEATTVEVVNSEGSCSICMMSIALKQKIYVLPCSQKHVFHGQCLRQWSRIKSNCPLCRAEIPTKADQQRQPPQQPQEPQQVQQPQQPPLPNSNQEIIRASFQQQAPAEPV